MTTNGIWDKIGMGQRVVTVTLRLPVKGNYNVTENWIEELKVQIERFSGKLSEQAIFDVPEVEISYDRHIARERVV